MAKRIKPKEKVSSSPEKQLAVNILLSRYLNSLQVFNKSLQKYSLREIKKGWYDLFDEGYLMLSENAKSILFWDLQARKYRLITIKELGEVAPLMEDFEDEN